MDDNKQPGVSRGYVEDEFFKAWIEKQVRDGTDNYFRRLRGIITFVFLLISGSLTFLGIKSYQATQSAKSAISKVSEAQTLIAKAHTESSEASRQISKANNRLHTVQQLQKKIVSDTKKTRENKNLVDSLRGIVQKDAKSVIQIRNIYADLLENRSVEYAFLRSNDSRIVDLYSFHQADTQTDSVQKYRVKMSIGDVKDRIDLTVHVLDSGTGSAGRSNKYMKLRQSDQSIPIDGTPFVFKVEFVYHAKLAYDFVVIKVHSAPRAPGNKRY